MNEAQLNEMKESYRAFRTTLVYADLLRQLDDLTEAALDEAIDEVANPMVAVSHLQNANGYRTIKSYILRMSKPLA